MMKDEFTDDGSTREHRSVQQQLLSHRAAGGAPDDPGGDDDDENDGGRTRNDRTNDWRDSRRRPTGGRDDYTHCSRPSGGTGIARDEMYGQKQFLMTYSNSESRFSGLEAATSRSGLRHWE
jgi:hypothetical protein